MTVQDIYNEILSKTNTPLNLLTIRRRINEAIDFFSSMYDRMFVKSKATIDCTDINAYYDIPSVSIGVSKVLDSDNKKYKYYEFFNNTIKFNNIGTYTVIANIKPNLQDTKVTKLLASEVLNVNPLFTRPIIFYVLSTVEKNPNISQNYMTMANDLAQEANFMAKRQDNAETKKIPAPLWR